MNKSRNQPAAGTNPGKKVNGSVQLVAPSKTKKTKPTKAVKPAIAKKLLQTSSKLKEEFSDELDARELLKILTEVKEGNFNVRMPGWKNL